MATTASGSATIAAPFNIRQNSPKPTRIIGGMDALDRYRDEFPILAAHRLHDQQLARRDAAADGARTSPSTPTRGRRAACARGKSAGGRCRSRSATRSRRIIGAPAGSVSMHENVTTAHMVALSSLRPAGGASGSSARRWTSRRWCYLYRAQQAAGFELHDRRRRRTISRVSTERMIDAIDEHDRGRRVLARAVPHVVHHRRGARSPRARAQVGAAVILDTYQSAGIIPVDVAALGVDFAVGGCLKWLCGGPGNAFLYTRPDRAEDARARRSPAGCRTAHPFAFDIDDERRARRRDAHDERDAVDPRVLRGARRARHHQRGRRRSHPRAVEADDGAAAGAGRRVRLHVGRVARSRAASPAPSR